MNRRSLMLGSAALSLTPLPVFASADLGAVAPAFSAPDSNGRPRRVPAAAV